MCPPIRMNNILYSTWNIRGALCLAKQAYCIKSSQLWQGETAIWCILSLFSSIKFLPLFGKKNRACWNYGGMPVSIMNVIKLSTMSRGVPNNFLILLKLLTWIKSWIIRLPVQLVGHQSNQRIKKNEDKFMNHIYVYIYIYI